VSEKSGAQDRRRRQSGGRGAATRKRLTTIAREMMAAGGEQSVSLVDVAERAGVTRGTVYHHFRKREDLIRAASDSLERTMEAIAYGTWEHDDPYGEPAAQAARDPAGFRSHLREMLINGGKATAAGRGNIERFEEFKLEGRLQPDVDPFIGAMLAVSGEFAALMVMQTAKTPEEESELIRRFSITYHRLLYHGILNPDADWPPRHPGSLEDDDNGGAKG